MVNKQYEVNAFCTGMIAGINLYQQKVITAQKNNEAIKIDGELYYIQSAKERLQDMIDKVCKQKERSQPMATDRQTPCLYYVCAGLCTKGRKADHAHYCQHCNKYRPRAKVRYKNQEKEKLEKIRKNERY